MVSPRNFLKNHMLGCGPGSALWGLLALSAACFLVLPGLAGLSAGSFHGLPALSAGPFVPGSVPAAGDGDFIRWVDFDVPEEVLERAFRWDVDTYQEELHINWVELLAYLGAKYGGDFSLYRAADMDEAAARLRGGESMDAIASGMRYYPYYLEAYGAVLNGLLGLYETEIAPEDAPDFALPTDENGRPIRDGQAVWVSKYGLKAFSPIASGFPYSEYDDFGVSRSYGYQRRHLGHDMMGQVGTPVIAVESGRVEALDWGMTLEPGIPLPPGLSHVGIRAHFVRPAAGPGPNRLPCTVERVVENVFSTVAMLSTPGGGQGFSRLRMELDQGSWAALGSPRVLWVELPREHLLLLTGS